MTYIKDYLKLHEGQRIYPQKVDNFGLAYSFLGLIDELGEMHDALVRVEQKPTIPSISNLVKESGDVLWYISAISEEANFDTERILQRQHPKNYPLTNNLLRLYSPVFELVTEKSGAVKKLYRDGQHLNLNNWELLLIKIVEFIGICLERYDITVMECLEVNSVKLQRRKHNNTIKGNGDER